MIFVERQTVARPRALDVRHVSRDMDMVSRFFEGPDAGHPQRALRFNQERWRNDSVRLALEELFHGKCAYCETVLGPFPGRGTICHHRPKVRAMDLDGSTSADHYWWLAYTWENIYPTCHDCNKHKSTRFPVRGQRVRPWTHGAELAAEQPLLLDPCHDDPAEHLVFMENGEVISNTERGVVTIKVLGLNRTSLVESRRAVLNRVGALAQRVHALARHSSTEHKHPYADDTLSILRELMHPSGEHSAAVSQLIRRWADEWGIEEVLGLSTAPTISRKEELEAYATFTASQAQLESYSVESEHQQPIAGYYMGAQRIERIELRDFKAIQEMDLSFPNSRPDEESWLMLLGENGTGKSSILKAVALALMGEAHANGLGLDAASFVRRGAREGAVRVHLTGLSRPVELRFDTASPRFTVDPPDPKVLLLGYGSTRILQRTPGDDLGERYIRVKNLFAPTAALNDAEAWLVDRSRVDDERFREVALALKDLLMLDEDDQFERDAGRVYVRVYDTRVTLEELSDGFQSVVALAVDIMIALFERWPSMKVAEGIVLLDEIEVHLHPTWKIEIVDRLRRCFPMVAFLVTTHDPLCLKGLEDGEIAVLRRDAERRVDLTQGLASVDYMRADQILTSPMFGLATTRGASTVSKAGRYAALYRLPARTHDEEAEFRRLEAEMEEASRAGETPVQRQAEELLRHTFVAEAAVPGRALDELPDELRRELKVQLQALLSV